MPDRPDHLTRFKPVTDEPLATRPISVKLPCSLDRQVRDRPNPSQWLRQVIADALEKEKSKNSVAIPVDLGTLS